MSEKNMMPTVESLLDLPKTLYDRARSVRTDAMATGREAWLTGLGAVGVIEDEGAKLVDAVVARQARLVTKGKAVESRGKARFETVRAKADVDGRRRAIAHRVEASVVEPIVGTLQRLGLPSRAEVTELSTKVDVLTRRVSALIAALEQAPSQPVVDRKDGTVQDTIEHEA